MYPLRHKVLVGEIGAIAKSDGPWLAVISSDDNYLSHAGGSARDIWQSAGVAALNQSIRESLKTPIQVGSTVETAAGALPAIAVLHAITLDLDTRISVSIADAHTFISNLGDAILSLRQKHPDAPPRVLMPLVGTGTAKMSMSAIVTAVSRLATHVGFSGIQITVATLEGCPTLEENFKHIDVFSATSPGDFACDEQTRIRTITTRIEDIMHGCARVFNIEFPEKKGLKTIWHEFSEASTKRGTKIPLGLDTSVEQAIFARNQVVHGLISVDGELIETLNQGVVALLTIAQKYFAKAVQGGVSKIPLVIKQIGEPDPQTELARTQGLNAPLAADEEHNPRPSIASSSASRPASPKIGGSLHEPANHTHRHEMQHVDNLVALLSALPEAEAQELELLLDELQYKGERLFRLKEYCARLDPMEILRRLGATQLRRILRDKYKLTPKITVSTDELAVLILSELGFPLPEPLEGISFAHKHVTAIRSKLPISGYNERAGLVIEASSHLESSIRNLLRFICLQVYKCGPEKHFLQLPEVKSRKLSSLSLGQLLGLLERLAKDLDNAPPEKRGYLDAPLTAKRLAPRGFDSITNLRNIFAHDRLSDNSQNDLSGKAAEFLDQTLELLRFWDTDWATSQPIYPKIIRVETITIDSWNRRVIRATTSDGIIEHIVTGMPVRAGGTYFMFPLSNPFRIDPLLIEFSTTEAD